MVHFVAIEGSTGNNLSMQQVIECNTFDISLDSEDHTHTPHLLFVGLLRSRRVLCTFSQGDQVDTIMVGHSHSTLAHCDVSTAYVETLLNADMLKYCLHVCLGQMLHACL